MCFTTTAPFLDKTYVMLYPAVLASLLSAAVTSLAQPLEPLGPGAANGQLRFGTEPALHSSQTLGVIETLRLAYAVNDDAFARHLASLPEERIVQFEDQSGDLQSAVITEGDKALLVLGGIRFVDITDDRVEQTAREDAAVSQLPNTLSYVGELDDLYNNISISRMTSRLSDFSGFKTRYYRSQEGRRSQAWLLQTIRDISRLHPTLDISVKEFEHPWGQNSIILHIPRAPASPFGVEDEVVIIGAHQDSTNLLPFLPAPGADDDGSGTITSLEALTLLLSSGFEPRNSSVEFHWYSAEEGGMLGSQAVASQYQRERKSVKAMLQMDMTAYVKPGTEERIGIIQDYVDPDLTRFVEKLIKNHLDIPSVPTQCGYACSDHSSWNSRGSRSAFAIEATFEDSNTGNIHSTRDTISAEGFSFDHMAQFVKLVIAFAKELAA